MMGRIALAAAVAFWPGVAVAKAKCLTDAQVDAAVGDEVRAGAVFSGRGGLPDLPLCSGLTLAQQIQRIHAAAFPEEGRRAAEEQAALVAREDEADRQAVPPPIQPLALAVPVAVVPVAEPTPARASARVRAATGRKPSAAQAPARRASRASSFASCREARAAGAAPIRRGDPGYSGRLDRDGDGVACE